jgi:macrolide transport system ATP-binding/permease protein
MSEWIWRIKALFLRDRLSGEKADELQYHLEMEVQAGLRQGLSEAEARRRARIRVGSVSEGVESTREEYGFRWLTGWESDVRHGFRTLTRSGGFGTVAALVLAASIAVNTLIFCLLEGVVLRPLPYPAPEQLVRLYDSGATQPKFPLAIAHYLDYQAHARSLQSIALYTGRDMELSAPGGRSKQLTGIAITPDYFAVLGRDPSMGRPFANSDMRQGVHNVIISHRFWQDQFQSDPAIIGKMIRLNREPWTIVGVAQEGFQHVGGDYRSPMQGETVDVWTPLPMDLPEPVLRSNHYCNAVARVRSGFTSEQARIDLARLASLSSRQYPDYGEWRIGLAPLLNEVTGRSRQIVWLLVGAGALVMLVACANLAGLCVARAVARRPELSVREALGASRWQLARVGLAENLILGVCGGALGLLLARAGLPLLQRLLPPDFPRAHEVALTWASAAFALAIALLTMLIAGLLPAGTSESRSQRVTASRESRRLRSFLVAGEVTFAALLCAGAIYLLRSYQEIGARDHGFKAEGVLTFQLALQAGKPEELSRLQDEIRTRIAAVPGVASVGFTTNLPWSGYDENSDFGIIGHVAAKGEDLSARFQGAGPGYFEAVGMRLLEGRLFDRIRDSQSQPKTVLVNDAFARRFFPAGNTVGSVLDLWGEKRQIVGVVAGLKDFPADLDTKPAYWFPAGQQPFAVVFAAVRTTNVDPASLTSAVTLAVHSVDPELPLADIRTLERRTAGALASRRFALWLFQAFSILALVLAAAGLYGLLTYLVQQRRKEFGIRTALGATPRNLWNTILGDGFKIAAAGVACSLILIPLCGTLLQSFLYNVKTLDLVTIAGAPAALLAVTLLASLGPARSATRTDPAVALRQE